ncbi:MAG: hypothetical protein Q4B75_06225 [Eubacteriales bacterium]|nr:hypothetical protein [Eubacteriales bacterium]
MQKGQAGYLDARKKKYGLQALLGFGIVAMILAFGIWKTHTRLNLFTVIAVLGCLPASKQLVEFITMFPYRSVDRKIVREIQEKAPLLTAAYDMVITSKECVMPIDAIVISGKTVFGYASNSKTDPVLLADYIKRTLSANGYAKMTVKIVGEFIPFISRAEGLNSMVQIDRTDDLDHEEKIRDIILTLSM